MKKRLAKKIEKMRRKKVHEALEMVLEINTTRLTVLYITKPLQDAIGLPGGRPTLPLRKEEASWRRRK